MLELTYSQILKSQKGLRHCITQKKSGEKLSFSLALHTGESSEAVLENRRELQRFFGKEARFVSALQVHSDRIYAVESVENRGWESLDETLRADALITDLPQVVLTILTADCVPILLYEPERRVIGAVHAGWQGSRLAIVIKCVGAMKRRYGADPGKMLAYIGPSIGGCCYEVGEEVAGHFQMIEGAVQPGPRGKPMLDLKRVNAAQLYEAGLEEANIELSDVCTACEREFFFSYRAEGGCGGRFMSAIMLESL
ncbi:peptidoglycan editing factor PgeF [Nitratifractor salsuginis]|uniref:Purine nucleoside phosphorylase n=1 Tax=Nitratifractor salsuginis (strain DSM 16511 / JCM 12458 / E9I37-1) TaxID=749222 RepID=E6X342_NITSE|nr:protein of unknown function DUF152 [Nitratifractor salsuginis DSM 16511]